MVSDDSTPGELESISNLFFIRAVSEAIESARDMIFIEDWWLVGVMLDA